MITKIVFFFLVLHAVSCLFVPTGKAAQEVQSELPNDDVKKLSYKQKVIMSDALMKVLNAQEDLEMAKRFLGQFFTVRYVKPRKVEDLMKEVLEHENDQALMRQKAEDQKKTIV